MNRLSTRESIIKAGDELIRERGFNAFSFYDISKKLGIKNASIHYHFPCKTDLGVSIVQSHILLTQKLRESVAAKDPEVKLKTFLSIYSRTKSENRVCIVGSLAPDLLTVDDAMADELTTLVHLITEWLTEILNEGKAKKIFRFQTTARTKALLIATSMLASLQLTRMTGEKDFTAIKKAILQELKY